MKKIVCLLMAFAILIGVFGCGKDVTENTTTNGTTGKIRIRESDDNYEIIGNTVSFDNDGYLDDYDKISIDIPSDIAEDDYYMLMGVYIGDDYTYYYLPDADELQNGKLVFETLHHSLFGAAKVDKNTLIEEWTKRAAVNIVTQNTANGKIEETLGDVVNGVLDDLNLGDKDYGGKVLEYILSQDTKGEILQAALNGDQTTMQQKTASLIADAVFSMAEIDGADDLVDVAYSYANEDNWAEGAIAMSKEIQKKIFPEIDAVSKFADLVDKTFDVWAANTMDEVYRANYITRAVDANGHISDSDWQEIYSCIHGAWARYNSKGISEDDLRASFEQRAKNEKQIAEKEKELKELTTEWEKSGLLNYSSFSDFKDWTIADRLQSLYQSRQTIIKMFTKDGKLQKGAYKDWSDDDFIDYVHDMWTRCGTKNRNEFYKWLEKEGIVSKPEYKPNYAWVLTNTEIYTKDNYNTGYYAGTYSASETSHTSIEESVGGKYSGEKATFTATCDAPPQTIYPDTEFAMNLSFTASGETELSFLANAWITLGYYGKLETKDGQGTFTVGTYEGAERSYNVTVYGKYGAGGEGSTIQLKFCACECDTIWTYEWQKVGK